MDELEADNEITLDEVRALRKEATFDVPQVESVPEPPEITRQKLIEAQITEEMRRAKEELSELLMIPPSELDYTYPDRPELPESAIFGFSIGEKIVSGQPTGHPAIIVYTTKKLPESDIMPARRVPKRYRGFETDVVESTLGRTFSAEDIRSGRNIRHTADESATLGAIIWDQQATTGDILYLLSCAHVLARGNTSQNQPCKKGDTIANTFFLLQWKVGELSFWTDLQIPSIQPPPGSPIDKWPPNLADCAVARLTTKKVTLESECGYSYQHNLHHHNTGTRVKKCGIASGSTRGTILRDGSNFDKLIRAYCDNTKRDCSGNGIPARYKGLIEIVGDGGSDFAIPGDSGALVVEESTDRPVALITGGNADEHIAYAMPLSTGFNALSDVSGIEFSFIPPLV